MPSSAPSTNAVNCGTEPGGAALPCRRPQLVIQVAVQGLAYGTALIFVLQLRGQIQDVLELGQSLPGAAIDSLDPGRFFGGDR